MLSLALEPECAALSFCKLRNRGELADYSDDNCDEQENKYYLVFDIGGGTVDITVLKHIPPGSYETSIAPKGCEYGGMKVNEEFSKFLAKIVGDKNFSKFFSKNQTNKVALSKMINCDFEKLKVEFGEDANYPGLVYQGENKFRLMLDRNFVECYGQRSIEKRVKNHNDSQVTFNIEKHTLVFTYNKMAEFFQPVLQGITECVVHALNEVDMKNIDVVFIAGGFGGCKYVFNHLKTVVSCYYGAKAKKLLRFVVPKHHQLAVSRGGVHYCREPNTITARVMDATYGIAIAVPFEEGLHKEDHHVYNEENIKFCEKVFKPLVFKGDKVSKDQYFNTEMLPLQQDQTTAVVKLYCSTNPNRGKVQYIDDDDVTSIGQLKLDLKTDEYGIVPNSGRQLKVSVCFSSTEITVQAQASYLPEEPTVKGFFDFLSK